MLVYTVRIKMNINCITNVNQKYNRGMSIHFKIYCTRGVEDLFIFQSIFGLLKDRKKIYFMIFLKLEQDLIIYYCFHRTNRRRVSTL